VLAPSDASGWFGGGTLVTADPTIAIDSCAPERALQLLSLAFESHVPAVAVAVLPYDGPASVHVYPGAWRAAESAEGGWEAWGTPPDLTGVRLARPAVDRPLLGNLFSEMDERDYTRAVRAAHDAIRDGDVYVLNLTYRLRGRPTEAAGEAFLSLNRTSPAPMAALLACPTSALASVSPERFVSAVRNADGTIDVTAEPIKGTASRDPDPDKDAALAAGLAASEKERAEHIMIVDLERNDLGRVCEPGSIRVDPLFGIFATPYCHQMVSVVRGRMRADVGIAELIEATFPCGSVTGAPKLAAMRTVEALECGARGAYTGALVVATPGRLDSSVLIRTLEYRHGVAVWGTGCGITIDSDPAAEWQESVLKTRPVRGSAGYSAI
jgi:anthranilate/para-aminobenzoate synthase component I